MSSKSVAPPKKQSSFDVIKWILIFVLMAAGIYANYHFSETAWAIRAAVGIVLILVLLGVAYQTVKGRRAWVFLNAARTELRKVVWPTRQETMQTTLIVVAMVILTAVILWGLDTFFMWTVSWLTGQRG